MAGIFELKTTAAAKFHFVLKAGNGEIILQSQQYEAKQGAENGIESVRANGPLDERFERKTAKNDEPYFVLKAGNGLVIGQSETYSTGAAMEKGIASDKTNAPEAKYKDLTEAEEAK